MENCHFKEWVNAERTRISFNLEVISESRNLWSSQLLIGLTVAGLSQTSRFISQLLLAIDNPASAADNGPALVYPIAVQQYVLQNPSRLLFVHRLVSI